jgi:phospholipid/cholesterol/gamma-HCH transport system substrate-binding protein
LISLAVVAGLIIKFGKYERLSERTYIITVVFPNVGGIVRDANVSYAGISVGKVRNIRLTEEGGLRVKVDLAIYEGVVIRRDAKFVVNQSGLLGDRYVDVIPQSTTAKPLRPGDVVEGASSVDLTEAIRGVVDVLHQAVGTMEKIDDLVKHTDDAIKRTDEAIKRTDAAIKRVDELVLSTQNLERVTSSLANIDTTTSNAAVFTASLHGLVDDSREAVSNTLARLVSASENLNIASKRVDDLVLNNEADVSATTSNLAVSARRLNEILAGVQSGQGTVGKLLVDPTLHDEVLRLVENWRRHGLLYKETTARPIDGRTERGKAPVPARPAN